MSTHIDDAFKEMDQIASDSMLRRHAMIAALEEVVKKANLDFEKDTARTVEVKLAAMKTLDDLLKGQENVSMAKVKLALSRVDTKTNQNVSAIAVEMLKRIQMAESGNYASVNSGSYVDDDSKLEAAALAAGVSFKEEEITEAEDHKEDVKIDDKEFAIEED